MSKLTEKLTASEVLRRYAAEERDFRGTNLRGQSFKGKDLSGADFSEADIRGANFNDAILRGTKFCKAKAGLQRRWLSLLVLVSWLLSAISGFLSGFFGYLTALMFDSFSLDKQISGGVFLVTLIVFFIVIIRQGLGVAFFVALAFTVAAAVGLAFTVVITLTRAVAFVVALAFTVAITGAIALAETFTIAAAGAVAGAIAIAFTVVAFVALAFTGAIAGPIAKAASLTEALAITRAITRAITGAAAIAAAISIVSTHLGWRTIKGDSREAWISTIALAFAATGGTSFDNADLTDANFTEATLKSTNLRNANLTRTCWRNTKKLERVRLGTSYLQDQNVRQLLITGEGRDKNFDRQDLRGLNLKEANLANASFIDTDFYQAFLRDANLFGAKLVRANLERADLTGACLTGACIQDWSVTRSTKLYGVECKYVFMKYIDGDKRDQMPPKGEFKYGEFLLFVRSILDTLDLYHERDVNPRAAVIVLRSLADDYQEPLEIVGLEKRGNGIIIKLKTSEFANQEQLKQEYYSRYSQILTLSMTDPEKILPSYEVLETKVTELVEDVKQRPTTSIKYLYNEGLFITGGSPNVNIEQGRNQYINTEGGGIGNIGENRGTAIGNQTNYAPDKNLAQAAAEIQQLLEQLSQTYPTSTNKEKMAVVAEAVDQIESNQTLKARVINALKAGGTEAFKEAIDHPLVNILMATIEGWQEAE